MDRLTVRALDVYALDVYALGGIVAAGLDRTSTVAVVEKVTQEVAASDLAEVMAACSGLLARMIAGPAKTEG